MAGGIASAVLLLLRNSGIHDIVNSSALLTTFGVVVCSYVMVCLLHFLYLRPAALQRALLQQGIDTLSYRPLSGDFNEYRRMQAAAQELPLPSASSHDLVLRYTMPFLQKRILQIKDEHDIPDRPFVFWVGSLPIVVLLNPDDAKSAMAADVKHLQKKGVGLDHLKELLGGDGIFQADGEKWRRQRNVLGHVFFSDKLEEMAVDMATCAVEMVGRWSTHVNDSQGGRAEREVVADLKDVTADILARTLFGTNHIKGRKLFEKQEQLFKLLWKLLVRYNVMPWYRFLPTADNLRVRDLENTINKDLNEIVESCRRTSRSGTGLFGLILHAKEEDAKQGTHTVRLTTREAIDDCKAFFFAGHETTANLLAWTMVLLSTNQEWQEKARVEVMEICGTRGEPTIDHLNKMRIVGMVLNESLRLYPPVPEYGLRRLCSNQGCLKLGGRTLPEGTGVTVLPVFIHRRKDIWGEDADDFNPERFASGVAKACKHPHGFTPFGQGPRACIGQHFALMEAKVVMAAILQRFRFRLSPNYKHAPATSVIMRPKHGVQVILESLHEAPVDMACKSLC